jgi:hypothetical protein
VSSQLLGVLIGGGITLTAGVVGQAASHTFTLRRERESRRAGRLTNLADIRVKAILDLQELAGEACSEAVTRPAITSNEALTQHRARLVSHMVQLAVPRARIDDGRTDELCEALIRRLREVSSAYDAGRGAEGDTAAAALRQALELLVARTKELLASERLRLEEARP